MTTTANDPSEFGVIAFSIFVLVSIILVHGVGLRISSKFFNRNWQNPALQSSFLRSHVILGITVAMLVLVHMTEVILWAAPIFLFGLIKPFGDSYLYVMGNYTTIGSSISVPHAEQIMAPMIAITGMFTFGWTGGLLASIMTQFSKRDVDMHRGQHLHFPHLPHAPFGEHKE